jgi:hypothetical protein
MGFLADNNLGDTRSGGLAGPMGLLLIIALGTITVLLIRNMGKRIKRLPSTFDTQADLPGAPETPDTAADVRRDAVPPARTDDHDVSEDGRPAPGNNS